jgi:hypothetical protein
MALGRGGRPEGFWGLAGGKGGGAARLSPRSALKRCGFQVIKVLFCDAARYITCVANSWACASLRDFLLLYNGFRAEGEDKKLTIIIIIMKR